MQYIQDSEAAEPQRFSSHIPPATTTLKPETFFNKTIYRQPPDWYTTMDKTQKEMRENLRTFTETCWRIWFSGHLRKLSGKSKYKMEKSCRTIYAKLLSWQRKLSYLQIFYDKPQQAHSLNPAQTALAGSTRPSMAILSETSARHLRLQLMRARTK